MNSILRNGYVRPVILFEFGNNVTLDVPPNCFVSFSQDRSVKKAASFELTLSYVPGTHGETEALIMHEIILSSVAKEISYQYGYVLPGGVPVFQKDKYVGMFTNYSEDLEAGYLVYKINGVGNSVELITPTYDPSEIIGKYIREQTDIQPSIIVKEITEDADGQLNGLFDNYVIDISHVDDKIDPNRLQGLMKPDAIEQVLRGKKNTDNTTNPGGLVSFSQKTNTPITVRAIEAAGTGAARSAAAKSGFDISTVEPFVCYFDNVQKDGKKGTFHYVPQFSKNSDVSTYYYGNSFLESDVLSFNVSIDCTVAMATVGASDKISQGIAQDGTLIGTNYNLTQLNAFDIDTHNTVAGFKAGSLLSATTIANALNFPFEASMTVLGEIDSHELLDKINVEVVFNGVKHPGLSGEYVILGITDDISESGFTTTFQLLRNYKGADLPQDYISNANAEMTRIFENNLKNDYSRQG